MLPPSGCSVCASSAVADSNPIKRPKTVCVIFMGSPRVRFLIGHGGARKIRAAVIIAQDLRCRVHTIGAYLLGSRTELAQLHRRSTTKDRETVARGPSDFRTAGAISRRWARGNFGAHRSGEFRRARTFDQLFAAAGRQVVGS